ncbi:MAG: signal peptidase I [Candidatus Weimeria sp.]|nr:signal peptidase I [Candidatus Weimeria sp.]
MDNMDNNNLEKTETEAEEEKKESTKTSFLREFLSWIEMVVIILAVVWVTTNYIIVNAKIPSGSMENTIMTGDRLIGTRFSYWFSNPKRGDIILFHYPVDEKKIYIKRVIGLPGEKVEIKDAKVYINGSKTPLKEDYLPEKWTIANDGYTFKVPKDSYLVLGDNRNSSEDARYWGEIALSTGQASTEEEAEKYSYVHKDKILGKAQFRYYPNIKTLGKAVDYR